MQLVYLNKVKSNRGDFAIKVIQISGYLGIDPNWLMVMMNSESGLDHTIVNPDGGATGLIQFMPSTAKRLGTTTQALRSMSNVKQLDYVYKYFRPYAGRIPNAATLYMINFFPVMVGKPENWVLQTKTLSAARIAKANRVIDLNKDGKITVGEFKKFVNGRFVTAGIDPEKKN